MREQAAGVSIESVNVYFGTNHVLKDVSLEIERGEFFTFLGPSGCGKTTLLRLIAGFGIAQSGRVLIGGSEVTALPPWERDVGMVFQSYALWPHMTVRSNVAFGLEERRLPKAEIRRRVDAVLGGVCDFTALPAEASVPVSVTYRAAEGAWIAETTVSVSTAGDVVSGNNALSARVESVGSTDLELRVSGSVGGPRSALLSYPTIELVNGGHRAMTPRLEVSLPAGVTVEDVFASDGICSGGEDQCNCAQDCDGAVCGDGR